MSPDRIWMRASLCALGLFGLAAGCIVVQPLEDYPEQSATGGTGSAGSAGSAGTAGTQNQAGSGACTTNADCARAGAGEPYLCRQSDHACAKLKTEVCPLVVGDPAKVANPNAIVVGAFATLSSTNPERNAIVYAHQLALEELSGNNIGGLPDGPNGARRPLVIVACYNQEDMLQEGLDHLVDDLEVPAVLATLKPGDLRSGFEKHMASDVFYLSPVAVTETVVKLKDNGLVWNVLGQPADLAPAYAALLPKTEKYVRLARSIPADDAIRVALVTTLDAFDSELANKVKPLLTFNGKSRQKNDTDGNYQEFSATSTDAEDIATLTDALVAFRPTIIVSAASEVVTMLDGIIDQTEAAWEVPQDGAALPMYILSPYNAGDLTHLTDQLSALSQLSAEDDPQQRFIGVSIAGPEETSPQFEYRTRLGARFGDIYNDTANYYDAVYLLAYAIYGAGSEQPLTGSRIAQGMQRLLGGTAYPIGPDSILNVFDALSDGQSNIEVQSTLGPPSFDAASGVRQVDGSVFCFTRSGKAIAPHMDTFRYDRALEAFRKTDDFCFNGLFP